VIGVGAPPFGLAPARRRDAGRLARILADWIAETAWMPKLYTPTDDRRFLRHLIATAEVTTVRDRWGPKGFLARDGGAIHALYLAPEARGHGLGRRLVRRAKAASPTLELWAFQANRAARRFYAREGFVEVEFTQGAGNDEGLPDVRLIWRKDMP